MSRTGKEAESVDGFGVVFPGVYELFRYIILDNLGLPPRCVHEASSLVVS